MSLEICKIYVDRLKNQSEYIFSNDISAKFIDIKEEHLQFNHPVHIEGKAYISSSYLIIHLSGSTTATMTCNICNEFTEFFLKTTPIYHAEAVENISNRIFNFINILREALLIELPSFVECNQGNCPERKNIAKYMKKSTFSKKTNNYFPFSEIEK